MTQLPLQQILWDDLQKEQDGRKERGNYWYASEIGGCPRKAFYSRKREPASNPSSNNSLCQMKAGGLFEVLVLDRVVGKKGLVVGDKKLVNAEREVQFNDDELQVHGRADLVVGYDDDSQEIIECKSQNSRSFTYLNKEGGAKEYHQFQLWYYLWKANIERGQFIYVSRDDLRMMQFPLSLSNQEVGDKVIARINYLNQMWADNKLPPQMEKEGGLCSPRYCPYYNLCKGIKIK